MTTSRPPGLYHLLAVSGQNTTFLALGVLGLAWLARDPEARRRGGGNRRDRGYVLAVGWQPSVVRAGVAGGLASLAWLALAAAVTGGTSSCSARASCSREAGRACSSPASSSRSLRSGSIFLLRPRLRRGTRGLPAPELARERRSPSRRRAGRAPPRSLGSSSVSVPVYSLPANALVTRRSGRSRDRARRVLDRAGAAERRARARLAERLVRRVHRRLCAPDRAGCRSRRSDPPRRSAAAARDAARVARPPTAAAVAATAGRHERRGSDAGAARVAVPPEALLPPPKGLRITFSTSAKVTGSCSRCQRVRCSSTRDRRRRTWRVSCAASASGASQRSCSRTRSGITSAARGHPQAARGRSRPRCAARGLRGPSSVKRLRRRRTGRAVVETRAGDGFSAGPPQAPGALAGQGRNGERGPEPDPDRACSRGKRRGGCGC